MNANKIRRKTKDLPHMTKLLNSNFYPISNLDTSNLTTRGQRFRISCARGHR